jgi:hypothetical protein
MVMGLLEKVGAHNTVADASRPTGLRTAPVYTVVQSSVVTAREQRCHRDATSGTAAGSTSISPFRASHRTASAAVCSEV